MAFDGTDPCWIPDVPIQRSEEWRMKVAQFGDGYAQRTLDGINALTQKWQVTFENRSKDVLVAMLAFMVAQRGNSFQFREPVTGAMYDVWCDQWNVDWTIRRWNRSNPELTVPVYYGTLSAEFVKVNGITV